MATRLLGNEDVLFVLNGVEGEAHGLFFAVFIKSRSETEASS